MIPRGDAHCAASMSAAQCSLEVAQECLIARVPNGLLSATVHRQGEFTDVKWWQQG
jgi:hypothetical protein